MLLSLFGFPVFALGVGCFPELRLLRAVADLLFGGAARFPAGVLVQVVEHLAQDRLEGAESGADRRCPKAVCDQTDGRKNKTTAVRRSWFTWEAEQEPGLLLTRTAPFLLYLLV